MKKRIISLLFCIALVLNVICPFALAEDEYYTSQTEFTSDALFQIIGPDNAIAQYFVPNFTSLQTVKVFTYSDNANTKYTLSIRKAHGDSTDLYTEEFTKADTAAAWFTMTLTTPLTLVKGEMYSFVVSSGDRAVVNGSATLGDISNGEPACRTYSYDKATRPDSPWVITQQRLAFEVTGIETSPSDAVISTITALPETITETDIAAVENAKNLYSALTADQKAQVTNYSKLQSAMEGIEDLYTDNTAKYYNKQTEITSTALFQIMATNNAAGQYFIPGFNRIGAIKVYTSSTEAGTEYTLRICTEPADLDTDIYTETFTRKDTAEGWFTMELSNPVNVTKGEKYAYVLTSNKSAVLYGDAESMGDAPCGTCNYDLRAYPDNIDPGWDYPQIRTAFKVIGEHFTAPEVIAVIDALPAEITDNDIKTVQYSNDLYTALLGSEKSAVTNYSKLEAALASVAALEKTAAMNKAAAKLDTDIAALPTTIALSDESKIVALETSYNDSCTLYGDDFKALVKNYATLTAAREALNKLKAIKYGDIDGNGLVTANDALLALQYSVDKITLTEQQLTAAGVDLNVGISASDALLILQFSVNKITVFPVEQKAE